MIRVVIADDHRLLLEGLVEALNAVPDIEVVGTAGDGAELVELAPAAKPHVMLVDLEMPGLDGLAAIHKLGNPVPTVIVSMHAERDHRAAAERAGAVGFLSKSAPLPDLAAAVRAAHAGERFVAEQAVEAALDRHRQPLLEAGAASLTKRERELLGLLAAGLSTTEELAGRMFISHKTVKNHLANIYDKLGVSDRAQAAVEAIRLGLRELRE